MAQKVQIVLVDDLDGGQAHESVWFALDGAEYEIDLSSDNATKLRDTLAPFVEAARKATRGRRSRRPRASNRERSADIRAWAKARGIKVNDSGRIPASIVEQYQAAR